MPCIYYGDEFGATGIKEDRAGGDDAVRPSLDDLSPIADGSGPLTELHREFIEWRRARPWLTQAALEIDAVDNQALRYHVTGEGGRVDVVVRPDGYELTEG